MTETITTEAERAWLGDLFDRREEGEQLVAYIESVASQQLRRSHGRAFTIALDASYGIGKTFFLCKLRDYAKLRHPVAYVDAWADDLMDEPLTALAATLKNALSDVLKAPGMGQKWKAFLATAGEVAKIAAVGAVKRGVGVVIGAASADAAHAVAADFSEAFVEAATDNASDAGASVPEGTAVLTSRVRRKTLMNERIEKFEEGKHAVVRLKASLAAIVANLPQNGKQVPIIIIIDELDRCRPTYAVKLLEEIKHLFDVPGLVFVLGMNSTQLTKSLAAEYGQGFDGEAYLRRFISRKYSLRPPNLTPLIEVLLAESGIDEDRLLWPDLLTPTKWRPSLQQLLALYMRAYDLTAREAPQVIDTLQTFMALTDSHKIVMPFLLPLIMGTVKGLDKIDANSAKKLINPDQNFEYYYGHSDSSGRPTGKAFLDFALELVQFDEEKYWQSHTGRREETALLMEGIFFNRGSFMPNNRLSIRKYAELLQRVGRFEVIGVDEI